ncbi:MAG TPA: tyrosine-protein phosphatase [Planctomycetota bacterium]|nr:tyrosine-protein phosphatase [Planctomycetota bacterium]
MKSPRLVNTPRNDLPGLANFAQISDVLFRGAQPTPDGFAQLQKMGIRTVVNLRAYTSDSRKLRKTRDCKLHYIHLRCRAWLPSSKKLAQFLKILRDPANQPVFVHCLHGSDRTGLAIGAYRIIEQGWLAQDAAKELHTFGFHGRIFPQILRFLKKLDVRKIEKLITKIKIAAPAQLK